MKFLRNYLIIASTALLLSCKNEVNQPNFLIIVSDDQGFGDLAFRGNPNIFTPVLDSLSSHATEIEHFYVSPVCAPTRASILTGRYHISTGARWVTHREEVMREEELTIAEYLGGQGYRTGLFGKWHNGKQYPHDPMGQGFQEFFGFTEGHINNYFDTQLIDGQDEVRSSGYLPDALTDRTMDFVQQEDPFFAMLCFNTPHSPFQVPDKYFDKYKEQGLEDKEACVYGMVENLDNNVGRVIQALRSSGKLDNTVIMFMSDNGPNGVRFNAGLKGIKAHVDEGGVRSVFLISYPNGGWENRVISSGSAAHIDILPTIADILGKPVTGGFPMDGRSFLPMLQGHSLSERYFFTHQVWSKFDTVPGAVRRGKYLLTCKPDVIELFDLEADPFQQKNISDQFPEVTHDLKSKYDDWFRNQTADGLILSKIELGHENIRSVEFPAPEIINIQHCNFYGKGWANDYVTAWTDSSVISWDYKAVAPGKYTCYAELSASADVSAEFVVTSHTDTLISNIPVNRKKTLVESPDRVKRKEVYEYNWPKLALGSIHIGEGEGSISLQAKNFEQGELKSIKLVKDGSDD